MGNYDNFNSRNYECSNCNSLNYRNFKSGFHGDYSGNEDSYEKSLPKIQMFDYANTGKGY